MSNTQVAFEFHGRTYGIKAPERKKFFEEIPEFLLPIGTEITEQSQLLKLAPATAGKQAIYDAHTADLKLLKRYEAEFEAFLHAAVKASIEIKDPAQRAYANHNSTPESRVKKVWKELLGRIPPVAKLPLLELDCYRAAKDASVMLSELQADFPQSAERLLRRFALLLHLFCERDLIGLIEWTAEDVCRYHYFRQPQSREVLDRRTEQSYSHHPERALGERNELKEKDVETTRVTRVEERHVHHVVNARSFPLTDYPDKVPASAAVLINSAPAWLKQHLSIVGGTITLQEIVRTQLSQEVKDEVIRESVTKGSPAAVLGDFNFFGWSSDDLRGKTAYYAGQTTGILAEKKEDRYTHAVLLLATAFCLALISGLIYWQQVSSAAQAKRQAAYTAQVQSPTYTVERGDRLRLPGFDFNVMFYGGRNNRGFQFTLLPREGGHDYENQFERSNPQIRGESVFVRLEDYVGDVDLGQHFGIPIILQVVKIDTDSITYGIKPI